MADIRSGPPQWIFMAVILGLLVAGGIVFTIQSSSNKKDTVQHAEVVEKLIERLQALVAELDSPNAAQKLHEEVQTLKAKLNLPHAQVVEKLRKRNRELVVLLDPFVEFSQGGNGTLSTRISPPFLAKLKQIAESEKVICDVKIYARDERTRIMG
eukprot:969268_1